MQWSNSSQFPLSFNTPHLVPSQIKKQGVEVWRSQLWTTTTDPSISETMTKIYSHCTASSRCGSLFCRNCRCGTMDVCNNAYWHMCTWPWTKLAFLGNYILGVLLTYSVPLMFCALSMPSTFQILNMLKQFTGFAVGIYMLLMKTSYNFQITEFQTNEY